MVGCRARSGPPSDLLDELRSLQRQHVWIARLYQSRQLELVVAGEPDRVPVADLPSDVGDRLEKQRSQRRQSINFIGDSDAQLSPDGKWVTYRTSDKHYVLSDRAGILKREIVSETHISTPMYWSPDGRYLMYCAESLPGDSRVVSGQVDMLVYRVKDGVQGRVTTFDELYPFETFGWLVVPADVESLLHDAK